MIGVILAGGKSQRMGFDKQLLEIQEERLLKKQIDFLKPITDGQVIVSNNDILRDLEWLQDVKIIRDLIPGLGPIAGLLTAMHQVEGYLYLLACDMPNVNQAYFDYMSHFTNAGYDAIIATYGDWIEPFHAIYSTTMKKELMQYVKGGGRTFYGFLKQKNVKYVSEEEIRQFTKTWDLFDNINTRDDLDRINAQ